MLVPNDHTTSAQNISIVLNGEDLEIKMTTKFVVDLPVYCISIDKTVLDLIRSAFVRKEMTKRTKKIDIRVVDL